MLQSGDDARNPIAEIHRSANAWPPAIATPGRPVRQVALLVHLQPAENRGCDIAIAHRPQRRGEIHDHRPWVQSDRLASGVGQVTIRR